jgi:dienelactone hydrolase
VLDGTRVLVQSTKVYPGPLHKIHGVTKVLAAGLAFAILAGCGSGGGIEDVRAKVDYDDSKPVKVEELSQGPIFTEIEFQSPRGNDVTASIAMPRNRARKVPAVLWAHGFGSNRNQFSTEVTELADRGIASIIYDSNMTRGGRGGIDLMDPVYAAEVFELQLRQDVVDARIALDILERRGDVDMSRIGFVGVDYGTMIGGVLGAVDDRIDAMVLATGFPEPSRSIAEQLVPPESIDGFAERLAPYDPVRTLGQAGEPILLQNARRDRLIEPEDYERLIDAADGAEVKWYDSDHELVYEAQQDRAQWLSEQLGVASQS